MTTIRLLKTEGNLALASLPPATVKMFIHSNLADAEKDISQWLKQNDVTIHHIAQSQSEKGGNFVFVLTIFYTEAA
jgi:hypothetical protein